MAIRLNIEDTHAVAFVSKIAAGNGGQHIYNLTLTADRDNGVIRGIGSWKGFDEYEEANAPSDFEAVIQEQAADGNWYVEVVEPADAVLVYEVPEFTNTYDSRFTNLHNWYNPSGKTVRAYGLIKHDIFELSEEGFTGTPSAGKTVTANASTGKLVVGA